MGYGWGRREERTGNIIADLYYPREKVAVEVDLGTETRKVIRNKLRRYENTDINRLVFFTKGGESRAEWIWQEMQGLPFGKASETWGRMKEVFLAIKP